MKYKNNLIQHNLSQTYANLHVKNETNGLEKCYIHGKNFKGITSQNHCFDLILAANRIIREGIHLSCKSLFVFQPQRNFFLSDHEVYYVMS